MVVESSTNTSGPYQGNGSTTVFARDFLILDATHLKVYVTENGLTSEVTSGITKDGIGTDTGNVTFAVAPSSDEQITLLREVPVLQGTDYSAEGAVAPTQVESDLDLATMRLQDILSAVSRGLRAPLTGGGFVSGHVPIFNDDLELINGPSTSEISNASGHAVSALSSLTRTLESEVRVGLVEARVDATEVIIEETVASLEALYDSDALVYLRALSATPTHDLTMLVNSTFQRLKMAGIYGKLDTLNIDFGISEAAFLTSLKDPTLVATNYGGVYTAGEGIAGDGVSAHIDTGIDVGDLTQYSLNSSAAGVFLTTEIQDNGRDFGFVGNANAYLQSWTDGGSTTIRMNNTTGLAELATTSLGFFGANRSAVDEVQIYRQGDLVDTGTSTSTSLPTGNFSVLRGASVYSPRRAWAWFAGASLTASEWAAFYAILEDAKAGIILTSVDQLQVTQIRTGVQTVASVAGVLTVDLSLGMTVQVDLTENITSISLNNWPAGRAVVFFEMTQDATGGRTVAFPAGWKKPGGATSGAHPSILSTAGMETDFVATSTDSGVTVKTASGGTYDG